MSELDPKDLLLQSSEDASSVVAMASRPMAAQAWYAVNLGLLFFLMSWLGNQVPYFVGLIVALIVFLSLGELSRRTQRRRAGVLSAGFDPSQLSWPRRLVWGTPIVVGLVLCSEAADAGRFGLVAVASVLAAITVVWVERGLARS
jgi:hypothetical protein